MGTSSTRAGLRELDPAPRRGVSLLDLDPDLGIGLSPERLDVARDALRVSVRRVRRGEWRLPSHLCAGSGHLGLLIVDGVAAREMVIEDAVSSELVGAGDLVVPWAHGGDPDFAWEQARWQVLAELHVVVLDRAVTASLASFPEVTGTLFERLAAQGERLARVKAIGQLVSVERRVLALFRHLGERWGRITLRGTAIPLALSHRLLGELIGARRPTVTVAVSALARSGALVRLDDRTWLLNDPSRPGEAGPARAVVAHRRRLVPVAPHRPRSSSATAPSTRAAPANAPAQSGSSSTVAPITAPTSGVT
jgi:CRP/FNR family transcriptional regulator, cyclic AMP receptor protein